MYINQSSKQSNNDGCKTSCLKIITIRIVKINCKHLYNEHISKNGMRSLRNFQTDGVKYDVFSIKMNFAMVDQIQYQSKMQSSTKKK